MIMMDQLLLLFWLFQILIRKFSEAINYPSLILKSVHCFFFLFFFLMPLFNQWRYFNKFGIVEKVSQSIILSYRFLLRFLKNTWRKVKMKKRQLFIKSSYNLNFYIFSKLNLCWFHKYIGLKKKLYVFCFLLPCEEHWFFCYFSNFL